MSEDVASVYTSFNIITDLYLVSIPVPMLWQSSLEPLKMIGFVALLSGGVFVMVCAILRSTSTVKASAEALHFVDY